MRKQNVLVISDTQAPFHHRDTIDFLNDQRKRFKCTKIVNIGDEVDFHAISLHDKEPEGDGVTQELAKAKIFLRQLASIFPEMDICISNHTDRPYRVAKKFGIPREFLKGYKELLDAPKGWKWFNRIYVDGVCYQHGEGYSGRNGAIQAALNNRQSTVIGHLHSHAGVNYHANENDLIFGMNVGCLIDVDAYAFRYGRTFKDKPVLGCGVVVEGSEPFFIPMDLGSKVIRMYENTVR